MLEIFLFCTVVHNQRETKLFVIIWQDKNGWDNNREIKVLRNSNVDDYFHKMYVVVLSFRSKERQP